MANMPGMDINPAKSATTPNVPAGTTRVKTPPDPMANMPGMGAPAKKP
jgi:hypothetical protein